MTDKKSTPESFEARLRVRAQQMYDEFVAGSTPPSKTAAIDEDLRRRTQELEQLANKILREKYKDHIVKGRTPFRALSPADWEFVEELKREITD